MMRLILSVLISFTFVVAYAQTGASIIVTPEHPTPRSSVKLKLNSYTINIATAVVTWKVDGKVVLEGQGQDTLTITTGDVGEKYIISARALAKDGSSVEQQLSLTPSSIILLYESPKSYVPLLYKGRSLPATGGLVRVTALPYLSDNGTQVDPSTISYSWYVDDVLYKTGSGLGKQAASIRMDFLKTKLKIKVVARTPSGNVGENTITVVPHKIMPTLYVYDEILGPNFNQAIDRRFETRSNFTLTLEPFYVSTEGKGPSYSWFLDGLPTTPEGRKLGFQPKENSYGSKMLSITVNGPEKRVQKSEVKTELIFDTREE